MSAHESWLEEKQSAWLYRQAAAFESDARISALFMQLAEAAEAQAKIWDAAATHFTPSVRARVVVWLMRYFKPRRIQPILAAMKVRGLSAYAITTTGHAMPTTLQDVGQSHRGYSGGSLRAAVFGVNDGLVSNTCLIMGVAGASVSTDMLVTTGVAGLLAGALSMAAGEYVSVRSQREMYEYQIGLERAELQAYPDEEAEELALIYAARGLPLDEARTVSKTMMRDPEHALNVLAREELGLNPDDLGSPWRAALSSFFAFAVGAAVPLLPLLSSATRSASLLWAGVLAASALFAVGGALSLFTGRNAWTGGLRMLLIGTSAGALTYLIGSYWA